MSQEELEDNIRECFRIVDADNSGSICVTELGRLIKYLLPEYSDADIEELAKAVLKHYDTDQSGTISLDEFRAAMISCLKEQGKL